MMWTILLVTSLFIIPAYKAQAQIDWDKLAFRNHRLVQAENLYLNCYYPVWAGLSLEEQREIGALPGDQSCKSSVQLLRQELRSASESTYVLQAKFPVYDSLLSRSLQLSSRELGLVPFHSSDKRPATRGANIDPWVIEKEVRKKLGVSSSLTDDLSPAPDCSEGQRDELIELEARPYDAVIWRRILYQRGYECAVSRYRALSERLTSPNFSRSQIVFEESLRSRPKGLDTGPLAGKVFVYFPNLSYDLPPINGEREKLMPHEMKAAFEAAGAKFVVAHRVTVEHLDQQVEDSAASMRSGLAELPAPFKNEPVILLVRSMGAAVARLVLERNLDLKLRTRMVINMGGTPFGSVIADYKGRADTFDQMRLTTSITLQGIIFWLRANIFAPFFSHDARIWRALQFRNNIYSMSHVHFNPADSSNTNLPILNVIFTPERIRSYFGGSKRIPPVDLVFYHMSMYGPTEGSAPLSHASWDTQNSGRVFYTRTNHLTFWELDDDQSLALWSAAIKASGL